MNTLPISPYIINSSTPLRWFLKNLFKFVITDNAVTRVSMVAVAFSILSLTPRLPEEAMDPDNIALLTLT